MGLFNFFRKKSSAQSIQNEPVKQSVNPNNYLIEVLKNKLIQLGYEVERHPKYLTLIVNSELEISTAIIDIPGAHPFLIQVMLLTAHPVHFPKGIVENLAGIGETPEKRIEAAVDNYLNSIFPPIMDGLADTHDPEVDIQVKDILWHPKLGNMMVQGQWAEQPEWNYLFEIIRSKIPGLLTDNKFNWLKIYISKQADGTIIGECLFNNEPIDAVLDDIVKHAQSWQIKGDLIGLKQFMMFRRFDKYDSTPWATLG